MQAINHSAGVSFELFDHTGQMEKRRKKESYKKVCEWRKREGSKGKVG